ncbi:hypothetical protein CBL_05222 [Carabus blaptoides fortunei]
MQKHSNPSEGLTLTREPFDELLLCIMTQHREQSPTETTATSTNHKLRYLTAITLMLSILKKKTLSTKIEKTLRCRFRNEYLGQLRQISGKKTQHQIAVGDVVMDGNNSKKRMGWPLGRIEKLLPGRDGEVRLVRVNTTKGQLFRPIQRICILEGTVGGEVK